MREKVVQTVGVLYGKKFTRVYDQCATLDDLVITLNEACSPELPARDFLKAYNNLLKGVAKLSALVG